METGSGFNAFYERHSARLKDLYIELLDYSYFHSPSEIGHLDKRFTGRYEVLRRLKLLLTDHETPAGAYLITGYRGAGKSSLVAQALSELSPVRIKDNRLSRFGRLLVLLTPFTLLGPAFNTGPLQVLMATIFLLCTTILLFSEYRRRDLFLSRASNKFREYLIFLAKAALKWPYLEGEQSPDRRHLIFCHDISLTIAIGYFANWLCEKNATVQQLGLLGRAFVLLAIFSIITLYNLPISLYFRSRDTRSSPASTEGIRSHSGNSYFFGLLNKLTQKNSWKELAHAAIKIKSTITNYTSTLKIAIKNYTRFPNRLPIKINLSQDNIQEKDILRLISKTVETSYSQFVSEVKYDLFWKFLKSIIVIAAAITLLHMPTTKSLVEGLITDLHISCALPSQGTFLLHGRSASYHDVMNRLLASDQFNAGNFLRDLEAAEANPSRQQTDWPNHRFHHVYSSNLTGYLLHKTAAVLLYADTLIQGLYFHLYLSISELIEPIVISNLFSAKLASIPAIPDSVNYLFVLYVYIIWNLVPWLERLSPGIATHQRVLQKLRDLNDMIEAQVTLERGGVPLQANSMLTLSFGQRKSRSYSALNERDIERHLLEVFSMIRRIPRFTSRPEFIIIFDELDKIQPHTNFTLSDQDEAEAKGTGAPRDLSSFEVERDRQQRILSLVSNLKHFFTTCPAKFIFIAGREMFDASLADVSDRHFFMGSVFNQVIHVPSFLSDNSDDRLPDISSLTEEYLCRFLVPRSRWHEGLRLKTYHNYLQEILITGQDPVSRQIREKIIYQLHNFVTYVTYRSNGAPKKITKTIERYLVKLDSGTLPSPDTYIVGTSSESFYLRFDYYSQYSFDIITFIGSPLIFSLNRAIKDFGDKILVSSAFLLDHIYKFHGNGFSWRNLELLPEIVDINRAPQLRTLISSIMNFLSKSDVVQMSGGLYDFKFVRRITEEISFLSKVSEHESAAFNFTLDESLALKRHFQRKLRLLLRTYDDYPNRENGRFINSISYVRMILGDLHFYDGDIDNAIIEYMEAVQILRNLPAQELRTDQLILAVRNLLKLGLAFEKKRSYDSALLAYGRVANLVADHITNRSQKDWKGGAFDRATFEAIHLVYQPILAHLALAEKIPGDGISWTSVENAVQELYKILKATKPTNRPLIEASFINRLSDVLFFKNGPALRANSKAYCEQADSLCSINSSRNLLISSSRRLPCHACQLYHRAIKSLLETFCSSLPGPWLPGSWLPVVILQGLKDNRGTAVRLPLIRELAALLADLGDTFLACSYRESLSISFLEKISASLDEAVTDPSNALDSFRLEGMDLPKGKPAKIEEALAYFALAAILYRWTGNSSSCAQELTKFLWVVRTHVLQSKVPSQTVNQIGNLLESSIIKSFLQESYRSHETTHRLEIEKIKEIVEGRAHDRWQQHSVNLARISINSSVAEALVLLDEVKLAGAARDLPVELDSRNSPFSMFHSVYSRIHNLRLRSRIDFHNLRALGLIRPLSKKFNLENYYGNTEQQTESDAVSLWTEVAQKHRLVLKDTTTVCAELPDYIEFLICDAIYCSHEISRLMAIYGSTYMASHSMKAAAHRSLALWCDIYYSYLRWLGDLSLDPTIALLVPRKDVAGLRMEVRLETLVGRADVLDLSPNYHADLAVGHFRSSKEAHSEGNAYLALLEKMYFLADDFSDQLEHFCAALERFQINSGSVDDTIEALENRIRLTRIFSAQSYSDGGWHTGATPSRNS